MAPTFVFALLLQYCISSLFEMVIIVVHFSIGALLVFWSCTFKIIITIVVAINYYNGFTSSIPFVKALR